MYCPGELYWCTDVPADPIPSKFRSHCPILKIYTCVEFSEGAKIPKNLKKINHQEEERTGFLNHKLSFHLALVSFQLSPSSSSQETNTHMKQIFFKFWYQETAIYL